VRTPHATPCPRRASGQPGSRSRQRTDHLPRHSIRKHDRRRL